MCFLLECKVLYYCLVYCGVDNVYCYCWFIFDFILYKNWLTSGKIFLSVNLFGKDENKEFYKLIKKKERKKIWFYIYIIMWLI